MPFRPSKAFIQSVRDIIDQVPNGLNPAEIRARLNPVPRPAVVTEALARLVAAGQVTAITRKGELVYVTGRRADAPETAPRAAQSPGLGVGPDIADTLAQPAPTDTADAGSPTAGREALDPVPKPPETRPVETLADAPELAEIFDAAVGIIVAGGMVREQSTALLQNCVFRSVPKADRTTALARLKARLDGFSAQEAAESGIEPDQYRNWRARHDAPPIPIVPPGSTLPLSGSIPFVKPEHVSPPAPTPVVDRTAKPEASSPKPHREAPVRRDAPAGLPTTIKPRGKPREASMPRPASNTVPTTAPRSDASPEAWPTTPRQDASPEVSVVASQGTTSPEVSAVSRNSSFGGGEEVVFSSVDFLPVS